MRSSGSKEKLIADMQRLRSLISSAPIMTLARLGGAGAGFLTQLMLARLLPPEGLGMFFAATSFASVLGLLSAQGYPGIVQRFLTRYRAKSRLDLECAFVSQVRREAAAAMTVIAVLIVAAAVLLPALDKDVRLVIAATAVCTAAAGSFSVYPAFACADRRFALGLLPETLIRSVIFLAIIGSAEAVGVALSAGIATAAYAAISAILAFAQFIVIRASFSRPGTLPRKRLRRLWRAEGRPLVVVALFTGLFADVVILVTSPFLGAEALAPFGVALKIAMLVGFAVQITHQTVLPDLAEVNQGGDTGRMAQVLLRATLFPMAVTLLAFGGAIVWGDQVLSLFGPAYPVAKWALVIMIAAQFIRAVAGPAPSLLTLKGAQLTNAAISVLCCGVLLVANVVLIPLLGLLGASLSVLLVVLFWTGASAVMLRRQMGIGSDVVTAFRKARTSQAALFENLALP